MTERVVFTLINGEPIIVTSDSGVWQAFQRSVDARAECLTIVTVNGTTTIRMEHIAAVVRHSA